MIKNRISRFPFTIGEIPTSFLISMTYEEQLLWLCNYIENQVIPYLEELGIAVSKLEDLAQKIDEKIIEIDEALAQLDSFRREIEQEVSSQLATQYQRVISLMIDYQIIFNQNLTNLDNRLSERIDAIELGDVIAYNPTNGTYENVSKVIQDVYDSLRQNAISCAEYDELQLTATEYDNKEITAFDFDTNGKIILMS